MKKLLLLLFVILSIKSSEACNAFFTHTYACAGDTVFFYAVDQAAVYTWDFGDTLSGVANVSHDTDSWHIYTMPGTYFVTLFVNIGAEWDYRSQFITIGTDCFNAQFSYSCYSGSTLSFTNESTGDYTSVMWDFGDPASSSNQSNNINENHAFTLPGTYTVTLITSDGVNSDTSTQQVLVSGDCIGAQFFNFLGGDCAQDTTHITVTYTGSPVSYHWDFGDTASGMADTSADSSGAHVYSVPGVYLVTLIVSNAVETDTFYNIQNIIDCTVWPGNVNTDGEVNMEDLFAIGIYYGDSGIARSSVSNTWMSYPAADWDSSGFNVMYLQDLVDKKHADCNGDGVINSLDIIAINQNYGNQQPDYPHNDVIQMMPVAVNDPVLQVMVPPTYNGGYVVSLPIDLSSTDSVRGVYGLAARIYYDPSLIVAGSVNITFNNSWLGTPGIDIVSLVKDDNADGYIDFGVVRTDKNRRDGNGTIAWLNFTLNQPSGLINFQIDPVIRLISNGFINQEVFKPVSEVDNQFNFLNVSVNEMQSSTVGIYPNPAKDQLTIHSYDRSKILKVSISDLCGKEILSQSFDGKSAAVSFELPGVPGGIYLVEVTTNNGISGNRVVVK